MLPQHRVLLIASLAALIYPALCASTIQLYSDDSCQTTSTDLIGPDGYPNGECTSLSRQGDFGSFKIQGLDQGCAVTIYGQDTTSDSCSGAAEVGSPFKTCYNSTWFYYSIDGCKKSASNSQVSSSSLSSSSAATSSSISSSSATGASTSNTQTSVTASAVGGSQSTTPSAASTQSQSHNSTNVGAIAGGVVGGVLGLLLIAGLAFFLLRRNRRSKNQRPNTAELPPQYSAADSEAARKEFGRAGAQELLPRDPPVEMQGGDVAARYELAGEGGAGSGRRELAERRSGVGKD